VNGFALDSAATFSDVVVSAAHCGEGVEPADASHLLDPLLNARRPPTTAVFSKGRVNDFWKTVPGVPRRAGQLAVDADCPAWRRPWRADSLVEASITCRCRVSNTVVAQFVGL